jgi:hypothetical protein
MLLSQHRAWIIAALITGVLSIGALLSAQPSRRMPQHTFITTPDIAFEVDRWEGSIPVGKWVVRHPLTGGQWVEPKGAAGVQPAR